MIFIGPLAKVNRRWPDTFVNFDEWRVVPYRVLTLLLQDADAKSTIPYGHNVAKNPFYK
jgi:hypothetical protein